MASRARVSVRAQPSPPLNPHYWPCLSGGRQRQILLYSHLQQHNDKHAGRKAHDKDAGRTSLEKYKPLNLLQGFERVIQGFACESVLETEHKLHILTPLLWPSCCVFLVLLDAQPEGPLGRVWLSLPHLVSTVWKSAGNCIGGFPSALSVGCGLPYHIWSLLSRILLTTALASQTQMS